MLIEGGTGNGYKAKVTEENQLAVVAETHPLIFEQSFKHGDTYTFAQLASQAVGASGEEVLATIENTSSAKLLCISHIHVCAYDGHGFVRVYAGSVSGEDGTAFTPLNHNRTSGGVAEATVHVSDGTLTSTGGSQVCTKALSPENPCAELSFQGSIILGLNDTMDVRFLEQAGATPAVGLCIEGFYIDKE